MNTELFAMAKRQAAGQPHRIETRLTKAGPAEIARGGHTFAMSSCVFYFVSNGACPNPFYTSLCTGG